MVEVEMSKDIRGYDPKIIASLSLRQLIGVGIGALCAVPVMLFLPIDMTIRIIIAVLVAAPGLACGFIRLYQMPCEVFFLKIFLPFYFGNTHRKYINESEYDSLAKPFTGKPVKNRKAYKKEYRPRK